MEGLWNGYGISLFSGDAEERHCSDVIDSNRPRPNTKKPSPRKPSPQTKRDLENCS